MVCPDLRKLFNCRCTRTSRAPIATCAKNREVAETCTRAHTLRHLAEHGFAQLAGRNGWLRHRMAFPALRLADTWGKGPREHG